MFRFIQVKPQVDDRPRPDYSIVYTANSAGKEAVGVKHNDKKAAKGSFLLYKFTDTYTFPKRTIDKAVCIKPFPFFGFLHNEALSFTMRLHNGFLIQCFQKKKVSVEGVDLFHSSDDILAGYLSGFVEVLLAGELQDLHLPIFFESKLPQVLRISPAKVLHLRALRVH